MKRAVVAGHICLDIIPDIDHPFALTPGRLFEVGAPTLATGGAVSNTGMAMHILGQPVTLMGKIGDDDFGRVILRVLAGYGPGLEQGMIVTPGAVSSYTLVVNIPGQDRIFLHCPGANHEFAAGDITPDRLAGATLFHLGYPPIMARMYADGGGELEQIFRTARAAGLTTSMDMVVPDPNGPGGRADWTAVFARVLPLLDIFLPSADELLYVLDRDKFGRGDELAAADISRLGERLLAAGVAVAGVKLGSRGLYVRTASAARLEHAGLARPADAAGWADRELWFPVYEIARFAGATGAGDATIAGFLTAMMRGKSLEDAGRFANAVGACNVQTPDALSGLKSWEETWRLLDAGWRQIQRPAPPPDWRCDSATNLWYGPSDRAENPGRRPICL